MNRRNLMGGAASIGMSATVAAGTLGITAQAAPAHPDAALIALAARYPAALAAFNAYTGPDEDPEDAALRAEVVGIFAACRDARPTTLEGLAAKARVALRDALDAAGAEVEADQTADVMARTIVHDLLRLTGAQA